MKLIRFVVPDQRRRLLKLLATEHTRKYHVERFGRLGRVIAPNGRIVFTGPPSDCALDAQARNQTLAHLRVHP